MLPPLFDTILGTSGGLFDVFEDILLCFSFSLLTLFMIPVISKLPLSSGLLLTIGVFAVTGGFEGTTIVGK
jgi:hypothetical protein